jgi:hypothetical protein
VVCIPELFRERAAIGEGLPQLWLLPAKTAICKGYIRGMGIAPAIDAGALFYTICSSLLFITNKFIVMPLLTILLVLIVVGVLLWLINSYIPMDGKIKNILNIVVVIAVVLWLLKAFGLLDNLKGVKI